MYVCIDDIIIMNFTLVFLATYKRYISHKLGFGTHQFLLNQSKYYYKTSSYTLYFLLITFVKCFMGGRS